MATVGAGLLSGWRLETALLLLAVVPALIFLGPNLVVDFGKSEEEFNGAIKLLWLYPLALAIGAFASTFTDRDALDRTRSALDEFVWALSGHSDEAEES